MATAPYGSEQVGGQARRLDKAFIFSVAVSPKHHVFPILRTLYGLFRLTSLDARMAIHMATPQLQDPLKNIAIFNLHKPNDFFWRPFVSRHTGPGRG